MQRVFFENTNSASPDYPYFNCDCKNINYVSHFHEEKENFNEKV